MTIECPHGCPAAEFCKKGGAIDNLGASLTEPLVARKGNVVPLKGRDLKSFRSSQSKANASINTAYPNCPLGE